jgi:hypothetical protein
MLLRERIAAREDSFLRLVQEGIFSYPSSPYLPLLNHYGITYADIERSVRSDGIERTLAQLQATGVYVTLDEFKGRAPIRRGSLELDVTAASFDNPAAVAQVETVSGGSRGRRTSVAIDLDGWVHDAACQLLFMDGLDLTGRPIGLWRPVPPGGAGMERALQFLRLGMRFEEWFSQERPDWSSMRMRYWAVLKTALWASRRTGRPTPEPSYVPLSSAGVVARWLADRCKAGDLPYLDANVSSAIRVCQAAEDSALDIEGAFIRVGSEAFTPARAAILTKAGCRAACHYATAEAGTIAFACGDPRVVDEAHLVNGKYAILQQQTAEAGHRPAGAIYLTALRTSASKVMLNVETGDYAVVERRRCGCPLGEIGFDLHLHRIRSYEKLTTEGMHFLGSSLIELVEEILPGRFGGKPNDYQFVETEIEGLRRVDLIATPRIGNLDEQELTDVVLAFLGKSSEGDRMMSEIWRQGKILRLLRREPYVTSASKVQPLHVSTE